MGSISGEDSDWSSVATSWSVSAGRLADSVAVESPLSPIDDGAAGSAPKTPLLLRPPSPDRSPCEITISFAQRHEVRQVYVRSTARVYEIYYAPKQQTANEYLCTVQCGIVGRDGVCDSDVPQAANLASHGDSMDHLAGGRSKSEINSNAGEDDWVEVKAPSTSFETNRDVAAFFKSSVKMVISFVRFLLSHQRDVSLYILVRHYSMASARLRFIELLLSSTYLEIC